MEAHETDKIVRAVKDWAYLDQLDLLDKLVVGIRNELIAEDYEEDAQEEGQSELDLVAAEHIQGAADELHEARDNLVRNGWQYP